MDVGPALAVIGLAVVGAVVVMALRGGFSPPRREPPSYSSSGSYSSGSSFPGMTNVRCKCGYSWPVHRDEKIDGCPKCGRSDW